MFYSGRCFGWYWNACKWLQFACNTVSIKILFSIFFTFVLFFSFSFRLETHSFNSKIMYKFMCDVLFFAGALSLMCVLVKNFIIPFSFSARIEKSVPKKLIHTHIVIHDNTIRFIQRRNKTFHATNENNLKKSMTYLQRVRSSCMYVDVWYESSKRFFFHSQCATIYTFFRSLRQLSSSRELFFFLLKIIKTKMKINLQLNIPIMQWMMIFRENSRN